MRTTITLTAAALLLAATLTGCAPSSPTQVDTYVDDSPLSTAEPTPADTTDTSTYLTFVRSESAILNDIDDQTILAVAFSYCDLLDEYDNYEDGTTAMIGLMEDEAIPEDMYVPILGAAVPAFCPQWTDEQQRY